MSELEQLTRQIQRIVSVEEDGDYGTKTARAVLVALTDANLQLPADDPAVELDARSAAIFAKLDPKIQPAFRKFYMLANAELAKIGLSYIAIQGTRTMSEQQALYDKGRTKPGPIVTNAKPGSSWHNMAVASDFGVFRGKVYLDDSEPKTAATQHARMANLFAALCGLAWGGDWKSIKDEPHYQPASLPASPTAAYRTLFQQKGSVL